ncbi:diguanylate cyclase [Marinobacter sp. F3R08]|uniref:sensor domain-containing diguanylate cyclase n=1 Tax=Marinobacter sp. F3R08 TaxID=2841559 RepID=UPI001C0989BE|nr:diguanylate cyclase [Marinobacter sp. F3R08]MBU2953738.1 sensor domain-containing diguanylate cyclase [Marinobacter sp. F3R08]
MTGRPVQKTNPVPGIEADITEQLQTALWIFDIEKGAMLWANSAGLRLWNAEDLESLRRRDFESEMSGPVLTRLNGYLVRFRRGETVIETWTIYPDGEPANLQCLCSGYQTESGMAMLVEAMPVIGQEDIPALRAQEALRHVPTLLSTYDLDGGLVARNPAAKKSLPDEHCFAKSFTRMSDRERVQNWIASGQESLSMEAPVATRNGERWHRVDLQRTFDPVTGKRVVLASESDITARVESEQALTNARERLAALIKNLRGGIVVEDENRKMILVNQSFCDLFGFLMAQEGADCAAAAEQSKSRFRDPQAFIEGIHLALQSRQTVTDELETVDGLILERTYVPIFHGDTYLGHLWQYWDITDQKSSLSKLEHEASHDSLTGLWNRRRFEQALLQTHGEALRYGQTYSLIIIDIDHFKQVNDQFGHDAGDVALQMVSQEMGLRLRQSDWLARWGGEEFVALLPQTELDGAILLAENLRKRIHELVMPLIGSLTISQGVAELRQDEVPHSVLKRADAALLVAKANGRNRVEPAA